MLASEAWRASPESAQELIGHVCVEHIFVEDGTAKWEHDDRREIRRRSTAALEYLTTVAASYDVDLSWHEDVHHVSSTEEIPSSYTNGGWTGEILNSAVLEVAALSRIPTCSVKICNERLVLVHVPRVGRSYSQPEGSFTDLGTERAVIYQRELHTGVSASDDARATILTPERGATVAHEILHLFGAEDFYEPEARAVEARRRYPDAVMLQSNRALTDVTISDYTAYKIGWTQEQPEPLP